MDDIYKKGYHYIVIDIIRVPKPLSIYAIFNKSN